MKGSCFFVKGCNFLMGFLWYEVAELISWYHSSVKKWSGLIHSRVQVDESAIPKFRIMHQGSEKVGDGAQEDHHYPFAGQCQGTLHSASISYREALYSADLFGPLCVERTARHVSANIEFLLGARSISWNCVCNRLCCINGAFVV